MALCVLGREVRQEARGGEIVGERREVNDVASDKREVAEIFLEYAKAELKRGGDVRRRVRRERSKAHRGRGDHPREGGERGIVDEDQGVNSWIQGEGREIGEVVRPTANSLNGAR